MPFDVILERIYAKTLTSPRTHHKLTSHATSFIYAAGATTTHLAHVIRVTRTLPALNAEQRNTYAKNVRKQYVNTNTLLCT